MSGEELLVRIGQNIKKHRKEQKLTQVQLGEILNSNQNYVSQCETGQWNLTVITLNKFANALGVDMKELVT